MKWQVQKQPDGEVLFVGETWEEANEVAHVLVRTRDLPPSRLIVVGVRDPDEDCS